MSNNNFFPFSAPVGSSGQSVLPYDLVINEVDPGLVLSPTEPNGVYVVFREVAGCSWWALNADYNVDAANWEQVAPQNPALPAYALEQCSNGTLTRYTAVATITPGTAVTWVPVWSLDANGNVTSSPVTDTLSSQIASSINITWAAGSPTVMNVREINLTDSSSNANSLVDNITVNGNPVWQVRKDGTLIAGTIPYARISGVPSPTYNNVTFTGTSTFNGPVVMNNGLTVAGGETVTGGLTTDTAHVTGNETVGGTLEVTGATTLASLAVTGNETVGGTLGVTGNVTAANYQNNAGTPVAGVAAFTTASCVVPAYHSTVTVAVSSTYAISSNSLVLISGTDGTNTYYFVCSIFGTVTVPATSVTLLVLQGLGTSAPGVTLNAGATISGYAPNGATSQAGATIQHTSAFTSGTGINTSIAIGTSVSTSNSTMVLLIVYSTATLTVNSVSYSGPGSGTTLFIAPLTANTTLIAATVSFGETMTINTTTTANGTFYYLQSA
jgi:hypothetical protein